MEYRRLGRAQLQVSVIGFGTCQLRLAPEKQAINTLLKGFDLGVNIVHTAPDYGNAEEVVARALRQTEHKIIPVSQGYDVRGNKRGPVSHFERLFETTCERFGTERLDLYGIACIDDREVYLENVWGSNGMVEFLLKMKEQGRIGGIFCTTHGAPEYVRQLVTCGVFDAVMVAYNILGYHLHSFPPSPNRECESLPRNQQDIFPLCREHDVGLMIMKPLAGGLLCESKAFTPYHNWGNAFKKTTARDILRSILLNLDVACVVPGTASVEEAVENALSGYGPIHLDAGTQGHLKDLVVSLKSTICSKCGACDALCSQKLPVSLIFCGGLMHLHPSAVFEQFESISYFRLHPQLESVCATCPNVTCACPNGINIPQSLKDIHSQMVGLMRKRLIPPPNPEKGEIYGDTAFGVRIVSMDIPKTMEAGETHLCLLLLENAGERGWHPEIKELKARVVLGVFVGEKRTQTIEVTQDVHRGERWHFSFEITAPRNMDRFRLRLQLLGEHQEFSESLGPIILSDYITVKSASWANALMTSSRLKNSSFARRPIGGFASTIASLIKHSIGGERLPITHLKQDRERLISVGSHYIKKFLNKILSRKSADITSLTSLNSTIARQPYDVGWLEHNIPTSCRKGESYQVYLHVENRGSRYWYAWHPKNWVELVVYIGDVLHRTVRIPHDVAPGENVILTIPVEFPNTAEDGKWRITVSFVEQYIAWFHESGTEPLVIDIQAEEPDKGAIAESCAIARRSNWGFWQPSGGIARSRNGCRYPMFVETALGCRVRDAECNEWIDYGMAGGAALLGYANPEVQAAIAAQLTSSAVVTLPHTLEIKVTQMLCDIIPCAEMVLFGKHGSDVCTVAVRIARLYTGRRKILFSGYHGWHEWYAETFQPKLKVSAEPPTVFRFELNNLSSFLTLVKEHSGEIAAVMVEPAAQAGTLDGPTLEADPAFLHHVAQICQEEKCILIFDEIVTGFRYPHGSVQQATGVIPDLACFGKALSAGMPLSALVGRREVMQTSLEAAYMPTFRGEVYSLAAAVASLQIYRSRDIAGKIYDFGCALKDSINGLSLELNVQGEMIGVPFRMIYRFNEPDAFQQVLMRTLLQQELLQRGILTYKGFMLPSIAHGEMEMEQTISAFRGALKRVQEVSSEQAFVRNLDIPLF